MVLQITQDVTEIWKDIEGYEGLYQISNFGKVKSLSKHCGFGKGYTTKEIILKPHLRLGYITFTLYKNGIPKTFSAHRLVANAFIPNIENKPQVNHINGIKTDNSIKNLEWVTNSENVKHAFDTGLKHTSAKQKAKASINGIRSRKLTVGQVHNIKQYHSITNLSSFKLSKIFNIPRTTIQRIIDGTSYKDVI